MLSTLSTFWQGHLNIMTDVVNEQQTTFFVGFPAQSVKPGKMFGKYKETLENVTLWHSFAALYLTMRQSVPALEVLTEIKTRLGEFKEALDLVKELQRLRRGVSVLHSHRKK